MAVPRARSLAGRPTVLDDDMAELGRAARRTSVRAAVQYQPSAYSRAEREHDEVVGAAPHADRPFGDRRGIAVVVELDGKREAIRDALADGHAGERDVHGRERRPGALVDHGGKAETHGGHAVPLVEERRDGTLEARKEGRLRGRRGRRDG